MKKILLLISLLFAINANAQTNLWGGLSATQGKTFLSLSNVENTALSTWAGTTNITTLGTISTGTWAGTAIANAHLANSSITIQGATVSLGGTTLATNSTPQFATIGLGVAADAAIPIFTVQSSATTASMITNSQFSMNSSGTPAAGFGQQYLYRLDDNTTANQNAAYIGIDWQTVTHASHNARYNLLLSTGGAAPASVFTVTGDGIFNLALSGSVIKINGTTILSSSTLSNVTGSSLTSVGTLTGGATGAGFTIALTTSTVTGQLTETHGGTNQTSYTTGDVLYASGSNTLSKLGIGSTGNVLTVSGGVPAWSSPSAGFTYTTITADQSAAVGNCYINNKASTQAVITLPSTATVGQQVQVIGYASNGWKIAQNASQVVHFGTTTSTSGTGGYVSSNDQYDVVTLVCIVANTDWSIMSSVGNLTVN